MELVLKTNKFIINDTLYEVISTSIGEVGIYNAIDTVRNLKTKQIKTYRRADLVIMLKKYDAKFVDNK
jgi:hypothetical protein